MFEQSSSSSSSSSIWASMNSWFTPAVFFVLLNVMIGTIALTSTLTKKKQNQNETQTHIHHHRLAGSVLQRIKSSNLLSLSNNNNNRSPDPQDSSVYKQTPDSDTTHETVSYYFFQENNVQVPQNLPVDTKQTPDSDSQNLESQPHYFFQENLQISQPQASNSIFEPTQEHTPQKSQTHFVSEKKDSIFDDFEQAPQKSQTHFVSEQKDSNFDDFEQAQKERVEDSEPLEQSMDEVFSRLAGGHFSRTKSDTEPSSGTNPAKLPAKMKKSASMKSAFGHFEEEDIVEARRPATVREEGNSAKAADGDEGVDAKADDFIHKFKQQLKLQRLDSIVRYKDMIGRGSGGR